MIQGKAKENLPQYYAIFIIAAMLPQMVGFNGSMLDTVWKLVVVGSLILLTKKSFTSYPLYSLFYVFLSFIGQLGAVAFGGESLSGIVVNTVFTMLMIILFLNYPLQIKAITIDDILKFYKIFVYFIAVACLYNILLHPSRLMSLPSTSVYGSEDVCSFFDNKNTFGVFLLFASLAAVVLKYYTKQKRWTLLLALIVINELMAACRTAIVISFALMIASLLISQSGITFKRIAITVAATGMLLVLLNRIDIFNKLFNSLFYSIDSMETRNDYVASMKPLIKDVYAVFGYGDETSKQLAFRYTGNRYFHNTYLNIMIANGMVGFLLFASVIFVSLRTSFKIAKHDKAAALLCILSCVVYLVYAYVESTLLFDTPVVSMVATILVVSMPIFFLKAVSPPSDERAECVYVGRS